jgi:hypothetical protein
MDQANPVPANADPRAISTLLEFRDIRRAIWHPGELAAMLRHQLDAPIHLSLGTFSGEAAYLLRHAKPPLDPLLTLHQLFCHAQPPLELLRLVKRFAKSCRSDPEHPLPGEIVMLLYYASIAAAQVRLGESISDLTPELLRRGVRWVLSRAWVDTDLREMLSQASANVTAH